VIAKIVKTSKMSGYLKTKVNTLFIGMRAWQNTAQMRQSSMFSHYIGTGVDL